MRPCYNCERFDENCQKPYGFNPAFSHYIGGCNGKGEQYDFGDAEDMECDIFTRKGEAE